jgi:hypothetical protein
LQTPQSLRDLWISLDRIADAVETAGDLTAATQALTEGLDIARDLAARLQTPQSLRDLCVSLFQLCRLHIENNDLVLAVSVQTEGENLAIQLPLHMRNDAVAAFASLRESMS